MADDLSGDALTLAGTSVRVVLSSWTQRPSYYTGARVRMKDGSLRSSEAGGTTFPFLGFKRIYDCQVDLYDQVEEDTLRQACPRGQAITVDGYLPSVAMNAVVDVGDVATVVFTIGGQHTILRTASLHIEEV